MAFDFLSLRASTLVYTIFLFWVLTNPSVSWKKRFLPKTLGKIRVFNGIAWGFFADFLSWVICHELFSRTLKSQACFAADNFKIPFKKELVPVQIPSKKRCYVVPPPVPLQQKVFLKFLVESFKWII